MKKTIENGNINSRAVEERRIWRVEEKERVIKEEKYLYFYRKSSILRDIY